MSNNITQINGMTLDSYQANLISFSTGQYELSNHVLTTSFSMKPIPLKGQFGTRKISLTLDFEDLNYSKTASLAISNFLNLCITANEIGNYMTLYLPDGFYYTCCFDSASDVVEKTSWIKQCTVNFVGFRHGTKLTGSWSAKTSGVLSSYPHCDRMSPLLIRVTPATMPSSFRVRVGGMDATFTGVDTFVEVDTLKGTVKDAKGNAFGKCNLIEFPKWQGNTAIQWNVNTSSEVYMECLPVKM